RSERITQLVRERGQELVLAFAFISYLKLRPHPLRNIVAFREHRGLATLMCHRNDDEIDVTLFERRAWRLPQHHRHLPPDIRRTADHHLPHQRRIRLVEELGQRMLEALADQLLMAYE